MKLRTQLHDMVICSTPAFEQFQATLSAGVLPHTAVTEPAGP
ncbi:hypothetical protein Tco_0614262, partial [Tanacetum coccineum]